MKVIQICEYHWAAGVSKYMYELHYGLKLAGYDTKIYRFPPKEKAPYPKDIFTNDPKITIEHFDYDNQSMIDDIESADVILVHQMIERPGSEEYKQKFFDFILNKVNGPKKVLFLNDHGRNTSGFTRMFGQIWKTKDFLNSWDKICIHCNCNSYARTVKSVIGEDEFWKKFVKLQHVHHFNDNVRDNWLPLSEKKKRATYIGRFNTNKHIEQVLSLWEHIGKDYEFEIRGIDRLPSCIWQPNLFYKIDKEKNEILGPSEHTWEASKTWRINNGFDKNDPLVDCNHFDFNDKIWVSGSYPYNEGMYAIRKAAFGMEFFRLTQPEYHGNNIEYCMHEIVEQGTVPMFDAWTMRSVKLLDNGYETDKTLYDEDFGVFLEPDFSNVKEVKEKMDMLFNDEVKYNQHREKSFEVLKQQLNPKPIAKKLINDIMKEG